MTMTHEKIAAGGSFLLRRFAPEEIFTPEDFTAEQRMYAKTTRDFMDRDVIPISDRIEAKDYGCTVGLMKKAGELGLLMSDIPEEYGGLGLDKAATAIIAENLTGQGSIATTWGAHTGIGTLPIVYFASDEIKKEYLPGLADGTLIAAYCLTENSAGSDALSGRTRAVLSEDGMHYILNGSKQFITNGAIADTFIVFAKIDGERFTGFLCTREMEGLKIGPEEHKLGIRGSSTTTVILEDVKVPVENLLGEIGKGHKIAFNVLNVGRYKLGVTSIGTAKRVLAQALAYALERRQFGEAIAEFGMIREKLANIYVRTWAAEAAAYRTVGLVDAMIATGDHSTAHTIRSIEEYSVECAMMKVIGTECLDYTVDQNLQIHGGYGFCMEYPAELHYRDSRINRIFEGTNEINRLLIPGTLLKKTIDGEQPILKAALALHNSTGGDFEEEADILVAESRMAENLKKLALLVLGEAVRKFGPALEKRQMVLARCADLVMAAFVVGSAVLRVLKLAGAVGGERAVIQIAAAKITAEELTSSSEVWAREVMVSVAEGEELASMLQSARKLTARTPSDILGLKEEIAASMVSEERSPFA